MKDQYFKIVFCIGILNLANHALKAQNLNYSVGDSLYVFAFSGLNIREQPSIESKVIDKIDFGQKIEIVKIPENAFDSRTQIENFKGNWLLINFNGAAGYAFDSYLSKLPNFTLSSAMPEFKDFDKSNEDPYEGHQMEAELLRYIEANFIQLCETVEYYDPNKGKGGEKLEITKLKNGYTKINKFGWEGHTLELVLTNTRLSEVKNLILYIAREAKVYPNTFKQINDSLLKINDFTDYQIVLNLSMFGINIIRHQDFNTWSIELLVSVS